MFHRRRTFRVRAWRVGHLYRSQSFQPVGVPLVPEQTDSRQLSDRSVLFPRASRTQEAIAMGTGMAFAPEFSLRNTSSKEEKLRTNGKPWCVLDSSFLLQVSLIVQNHNPVLAAERRKVYRHFAE